MLLSHIAPRNGAHRLHALAGGEHCRESVLPPILEVLLQRAPRSWRELAEVGFRRSEVHFAVEQLARGGKAKFRIDDWGLVRLDHPEGQE